VYKIIRGVENMHFTIERIKRILAELNEYRYNNKVYIDEYKIKEARYRDYSLLNSDSSNWRTFKRGDSWGGVDAHYWFKTKVVISEALEGKSIVYIIRTGREGGWDIYNPQFLLYVNGEASQGLDVNHRIALLSEEAKVGKEYELDLFAYSGVQKGHIELDSFIAIVEKDVERLYYNILVPLEVAERLEAEDKRAIDILKYLTNAINIIDLRKPFSNNFYASISNSNEYLESEFYSKYCGHEDMFVNCIGHTHIDVAYRWTIEQTREKVARSFSTVLKLMEEYEDYKFISSQPQLYKFLKEDHPEIYKKVKNRIKEGRWEAEGAMWLEADCNLTSGESLVRQLLFGQRFFKEEFNIESKILWLPDVFGYSAALPQILKKSGIDYFITSKISWNEYNKMPYDTFMWKGIDGTEILSHFITTTDYKKEGNPGNGTTYNGVINASQVMGCWQRYQQKDINNEVINCFGYGDGGGGATREMLENAKRLEKGIPGAPRVKIGKTIDFLKNLESKVIKNKKLPKWVGELYLEYHRGTYTTMARNKKFNRKTEFLNLDAELFALMSNKLIHGQEYPQKVINECWETTLLNQFHDIIPGSSIKPVYEVSKEEYKQINTIGKNIVQSALDNICSNINIKANSIAVFNQLSFNRSDLVTFELPLGWTNAEVYDNDEIIVSQKLEDNKIVFFAENVPAKGYKTFRINNSEEIRSNSKDMLVTQKEIDNSFFNIKLDKQGNINSIYDKVNHREVIKIGESCNILQAFEDKPHKYDAWDINIYYSEKMWEVNEVESIEVVELGPVRASLKISRKFEDSIIIQTLYIYKDIPRIDFSTWIDWKERQVLLKAAFPVDVHSDKATYEIQYGNLERPTHWNTSWDKARFEVCAHKWADLSEGGYGVAILNDCKYGHDVKDSVMRLTLLKSPISPNEDSDREIHEFNYSLYPHCGDWKEGKVIPMAYSFNCPMYVKLVEPQKGILPENLSFISIDKENVIVEVIKKAENSEDIIVRLYECYNKRTKVVCRLVNNIEQVNECDLMEQELSEIAPEDNRFEFTIKPYEIKTFKIKLIK
jgi:alpha-mannosidase